MSTVRRLPSGPLVRRSSPPEGEAGDLDLRELNGLAAGMVIAGVAVSAPAVVANARTAPHEHRGGARARNVIFINGDGMGPAHREAARLFRHGFDGQLGMDQLPVSGQSTTSPHDPGTLVSDSAAGASAWATGQKTRIEAISVDMAGDGISAEDGPFPVAGSELRFSLDWTTTHHTGVDIPVTAVGPQASSFTGNTRTPTCTTSSAGW